MVRKEDQAHKENKGLWECQDHRDQKELKEKVYVSQSVGRHSM